MSLRDFLRCWAPSVLLSLAACAGHPHPVPGQGFEITAYERELDVWRSSRLESLTGPDGWTTLAGLFWLEGGKSYSVGSDPSSDIALPADHAPARIGSLTVLQGDSIQFTAAPGAAVTEGGQPVAALMLRSDSGGGKPTVLASGSVTIRVIERSGKLALRVKDSLSARRTEFKGLSYFPANVTLRVDAALEPHDPPRKLKLVNVLGRTEELESPGMLAFAIDGRPYRLEAAKEAGENELFIIFGDATNGGETYPSGRFLHAAPPDARGRTVLDFNRAFNPPCAFTPFATCPLPPAGNVLPIAIRAGELRYAGPHE